MPSYRDGKIYTIRCRISDDIYVGSTTQPLYKRYQDHKDKVFNENNKEYHRIIYQKMRELGIDNFYIELYEQYPCNSKEELNKREGEVMRLLNPTLNKLMAGRTYKEKIAEERDDYLNRRKQQYKDNREKILEQQRAYRKLNKDVINDRKRTYHEKNKDYFKSIASIDVKCDCGRIVKIHEMTRHKRSLVHQNLMICEFLFQFQ